MTVQELIGGNGKWDEERVKACAFPHEIHAILNTPLGEKSKEDELWWSYGKHGLFTVKSAYRLYMGHLEQHEFLSKEEKTWWGRHVWNLSIAPKVKIFLWRLFHDFIPTAANLNNHHVPIDAICRLCKDRWDSSVHALFFCPTIRKVWKQSLFWKVIKKGEMTKARDVAEAIRRELEIEDYEVWSITVWNVWSYSCNLMNGDGDRTDEPIPTMEESRILWSELKQKVWPPRAQNRGSNAGPRAGVCRGEEDIGSTLMCSLNRRLMLLEWV